MGPKVPILRSDMTQGGSKTFLTLEQQTSLLNQRLGLVTPPSRQLRLLVKKYGLHAVQIYTLGLTNDPDGNQAFGVDRKYVAGTTIANLQQCIEFEHALADIILTGTRIFELWARAQADDLHGANQNEDSKWWLNLPELFKQISDVIDKRDSTKAYEPEINKDSSYPNTNLMPTDFYSWEALRATTMGCFRPIFGNIHSRDDITLDAISTNASKRLGFSQDDRSYSKFFQFLCQELAVMRNKAAHHKRLCDDRWDNILIASRATKRGMHQSSMPNAISGRMRRACQGPKWEHRLGCRLILLSQIVDSINDDNQWSKRLVDLLENAPSGIPRKALGLADHWKEYF